MRMSEEFGQDLRYGLRMMRKSPAFTSVAVIILALGIGTSAAIVSLIDTIIFRSLPVSRPDRLASINPSSLPDYNDLKAGNQTFSGLAAFAGLTLAARDLNSEMLSGRAVSANSFDVLGLTMAAGRGFLPEEDALPGGRPVAVISYRYWQRVFGGDPAALGKSIGLNGELHTIVGVAPKNFGDLFVGAHQDVWVPIPMFGKVMHVDQLPIWQEATGSRDQPWLTLVGHLKDGVALEQARAQVEVLADTLRKIHPRSNGNWRPKVDPLDRVRWPDRDNLFPFAILVGTAMCVLMLTSTKVANLLLARGSARGREIAARIALGARRSDLQKSVLRDGMISTFMGLAIGLPASLVISRLIAGRLHGISALDPITYASISILCISVSIAATLLPARRAYSNRPTELLRHE